MTETMITCPHCMTEFKLTESLAAPLIEATRRQYQAILAEKEEGIGKREAAIRERQNELAKAQESIDEQVASKLKGERARIAAEEARNARLSLSIEIDQRDKQVAELQEVLQEREAKLAEAQKAQAELVRKQRELDDATREMDLTIETRGSGVPGRQFGRRPNRGRRGVSAESRRQRTDHRRHATAD